MEFEKGISPPENNRLSHRRRRALGAAVNRSSHALVDGQVLGEGQVRLLREYAKRGPGGFYRVNSPEVPFPVINNHPHQSSSGTDYGDWPLL